MVRGTTLEDPVDVDHRPNLVGGNHAISEYLKDQGAYDLFSYLLKELLTNQPEDPLQHMLHCLQAEYALGPLKVFISSPPGIGRSHWAKRLAEHFGLEYIGAGALLREAGEDTAKIGYFDEAAVAELVMQRVREASEAMRGFVLDGFPRTRFQTSFLKGRSVVPTHVLVLKACTEKIRLRHALVANGTLPPDADGAVPKEALEQKLRLHSCHSSSALETYKDKICVVEVLRDAPDKEDEEAIFRQMESRVRMLPRSRGPHPPPRVVLLGPRGIGVKEHASRLAARLGAVFVDAAALRQHTGFRLHSPRTPRLSNSKDTVTRRSEPSLTLPNEDELDTWRPSSQRAAQKPPRGISKREDTQDRYGEAVQAPWQDPLGEVGMRLRHPDCAKQGWVLCGFPLTLQHSRLLLADVHLVPMRVIVLQASAETCVRRLRNILTDSITGKVWTSLPKNENIRKRLQRRPEDHPMAVREAHMEHCNAMHDICELLNVNGQCEQIDANGPPESVHSAIIEFVERPLPLPPRS